MPKFTRRHYAAIADCIADSGLHTKSGESIAQLETVKHNLAVMFARDNPRFKRDRFLRACKWQPNRLAAEWESNMTLAYFDSFAGLVPCRIVAVGDWADSSSLARVQYTATRGAYKRGEFDTQLLRNIVPRRAVFVRSGQYRIRAYSWETERSRT